MIASVHPKNDVYPSCFVVLCFGSIIHINLEIMVQFVSHSMGLADVGGFTHILHGYFSGHITIFSVPVKQPWKILVDKSHESTKNTNQSKAQQNRAHILWDINCISLLKLYVLSSYREQLPLWYVITVRFRYNAVNLYKIPTRDTSRGPFKYKCGLLPA